MTVVISKPSTGATLKGAVVIEATFSGQRFDVATVTLDGTQLGSDTAQPIAFVADTTKVTDGAHTLTVAVRYRTAGGKLRWQKAAIPVTVKNAVVPPPSGWVKVATEHQSFTLSESKEVRYGAGSSWLSKILSVGTYACESSFFGGDPAVGTLKSCEARASGTPPPPPSNVAMSAPTGKVI